MKTDALPDFYSKGMAATVRAVALAALADHGRVTAADLSRYRDHMPQMSLFGLAHFLQAALKTKGGDKTAAEAFKRLMAHSHQSSGQALFTETLDSGFARLLSSSARTQGAILSALTAYATAAQSASQVGDLPMRLTRAITLERGRRAHWANTQENIFCLKALVDYSAVYEKESPAMTVKALLDAQPLGETAFQDRQAEASRPCSTRSPWAKPFSRTGAPRRSPSAGRSPPTIPGRNRCSPSGGKAAAGCTTRLGCATRPWRRPTR
ncbi:MAG: hypothetical protein HZB24_03550 [Desulfobacterales bacterium]|nr:hypothetical protein [Desulfobacterales bacterium]